MILNCHTECDVVCFLCAVWCKTIAVSKYILNHSSFLNLNAIEALHVIYASHKILGVLLNFVRLVLRISPIMTEFCSLCGYVTTCRFSNHVMTVALLGETASYAGLTLL